ncbi:MAG TPA: tRNA (adenosine(37)-N6)-dimethylallyltransferase MiaA [Azospirillaceae bacterium]|nr:tRNA (adenosine(37)-N6)-dimethylallyltransferase MiaA [Azospirillaceae bacterium]
MLVIGGPTASGKSGLALALAERLGGTVINADSMQVYAELRIVTARPGPGDEARAPHRLYGVVPASVRMSAARWRELALAEIAAAQASGRLPVVVGGTGLYLRALMEGLSDIPPIPEDVRAAAKDLHARLGGEAFHAELSRRDPAGAAKLFPGDTQRLVRAWEVIEATGRTLGDWQAAGRETAPDLDFHTLVVEPPRDRLYAACDARFLIMLEQGALEEVRMLATQGLDEDLPVMKALGVPELLAHLRGQATLAEATARAQQLTRNYAKRQTTWFRHQMGAARRVDPGAQGSLAAMSQLYDTIADEFFAFVRKTH